MAGKSKRRAFVFGGFAIGLPLLGLGAYWFAPHKAFIDDRVDEGLPSGEASEVSKGTFQSLEHDTSGAASVIRASDGKHVLRVADLKTSNGPDLRVYLSAVEATDNWTIYGKQHFVDLGALKGNLGSANYDVPADVDVTQFKSAVIWCKRFGVAFGVAPLVAP